MEPQFFLGDIVGDYLIVGKMRDRRGCWIYQVRKNGKRCYDWYTHEYLLEAVNADRLALVRQQSEIVAEG